MRRLIPLLATKLRLQLTTRRQLLNTLLRITPLLATKLKPNPITQKRLLIILQQLTPVLAIIPQLVITTRILPITLTQQLLLTTMLHRLMEPNPTTITSTSISQRILIILRQLLPLMATSTKSMVTIPLLLATHMDLLPSPQRLLIKLQRATISPAITIAHTTWNLLPVPMKNFLPTTMPMFHPITRKLDQVLRHPTRNHRNITPTKLRTTKRVQLTTPPQPHSSTMDLQNIIPPLLLPTSPPGIPVQSSSLRIMKRNSETTTLPLPSMQPTSQSIIPQTHLLDTITLPRLLASTTNQILDTTMRILPTPAANQLRATVTSLGRLFLPIAHTHHIK